MTTKPLRAGGNRLWQTLQRARRWSLSGAIAVTLLLGTILGQSTLATAQPVNPGADPSFFPATGYRISSPAVLDYFQRRGGVRTLGYPISSEFPLLGKRVQLFQRQMLEIESDGSVVASNILDPGVLPITNIDGLSLPAPDPDVVAAAPSPDAPDYATQALAFVNVYVPDDWNGLQVNFQTTFLNSVTCGDAFGSDPCDPSQLANFDLQLWGLPTSLPTADPSNSDFVYQRFQRGIMHFSRATGTTQGLLIGDWLKRVMIGVDLSPDLNSEVRQSRYFAQYAPSQPLSLDRPTDLPDTSLAQAFRSDSLSVAQVVTGTPTLPVGVAATATAVALTATAISGTQISLSNSQSFLTSTALAQTATSVALGASAQFSTPTATPGGIISSIPVVNVGCLGDEQMWFVPRKPNVGVHVAISVTSQRHHDARSMALGGPIDPGSVTEHEGPLGFIWSWTVQPQIEGFYQWTFYADGLRPCITSGFNAFAPVGATQTPTNTPVPTNTPGSTATPTPTVVPIPTITTASQSAGCGGVVTIVGNNYGSPPSTFGTNVQLLGGPANAGTPKLLNLIGGSNTQITATLPSTGMEFGAGYQLIVTNNGGASNTSPFTVTGGAPGTFC